MLVVAVSLMVALTRSAAVRRRLRGRGDGQRGGCRAKMAD
jgi:hypothetical protein